MKIGGKAGGKAASARRRKAVIQKRGKATGSRRGSSLNDGEEANIVLLRRERDEAVEQQRATSEILRAISNTSPDATSILRTIAESVARLLNVTDAEIVMRTEGDQLESVAKYGPSPNWPVGTVRPVSRDWVTGRAVVDRTAIHVPDLRAAQREFPQGAAFARQFGHRTTLGVPLLREGSAIGAILIRRMEVKPFTDRQIELVLSYASQAVIAIENARLFNEVQARTRDLEESLQQQTAAADVLKVISRSAFDLQPVFSTIVQTASRLCEAEFALIYELRGDKYEIVSFNNAAEAFVQHAADNPLRPGRGSLVGRTALEHKPVHIPDCLADPEYSALDYQTVGRYRAMLGVPLLREGKPIGVIGMMRTHVRPFTEKQIELVTTFADQAVIAIENVRLFEEVQGKTRDLEESLHQQTAMADVLKVISRSAFDLQPVFDTVAENSAKLCEADRAFIYRFDGELLRLAASYNAPPDFERWVAQNPMRLSYQSGSGRAGLERRTIHIHDVRADPEYTFGAKDVEAIRTILGVPILKGDELLGVMMIYHLKVKPFTNRQIALVETFADQAAIAIENVRLFREVQQRTDDLAESLQQQTATAEVLKVISRSTFDLPAVLHALVETAARLCSADKGTITRQKDGVFFRAESFGFSEDFMNYVRGVPVIIDRHSATGRALFEGVVIHIPDVEADHDYTFHEGQRLGDFRALLGVPMLREGVPIGVITLTRTEPEPFTEKQIELAITFADQAAIAIENVRLFDEVQARTKELSESLDELRKAQDRLIQTEKLASLGQLTAGIAHEIKNPLNFVNNFSALSIELADELNELLKQAQLAGKLREEVGELTTLLKDNLSKVVQHGSRADSIVKNMLLHSREGSGEHRPADINALVEESLNLAYHGARAEKVGFSITLEQDLDPEAGALDLYPQEMTRALLNLISNGFYAATRRKVEAGEETFEPVLSAATKNLGRTVEIRIRDNGSGIPPEVRKKMFNPFFTTKPTGEGTGLGLSMTHDIIVKQHGGRIDVETEPGAFTEFIITLPRGNGTVID